MNLAKKAFIVAVSSGLTARRATRADLWAETYRIMGEPFPGKFTFAFHPWTRDMLNDDSEQCVGQKAAQMGFTDSVAMNRAFFTIDQLHRDVLYVLPAQTPDATDFSAARFDPALERSPYLAQLFTRVKNVGLKRAGANSLYVRGSRSRSALKSLPVGLIVLDEEDEFDQEAIILMRERISGQREGARQIWHISTPSVPGNGINITFERSSKAHFFFKCPHCSRHIELLYPESITMTDGHAAYICHVCKAIILQQEKIHALATTGRWVHANESAIHGYQVNQMYSPVITAPKFQESADLSKTNSAEEQEFHNSKLGEAHVVSEARVTVEHIEACTIDYKMGTIKGGLITMGIDVGNTLHVEIDQWQLFKSDSIDINDNMIPKVLLCTTVPSFEDIDNLLYLYQPRMAIIDDMPDTRASMTLARRHPGRVKLCHYGSGQDLVQYEERISVNRTSWLDRSLGRIIHGMIRLPSDLPVEWKSHIQCLVRKPEKAKDGTIIHRYLKTGEDHFAHARNYAEIALACTALGENQIITRRTQ